METILHLLSQLPKPAQQQVKEFVESLLKKHKETTGKPFSSFEYPLQGSVLKFEDPFEPASSDWEAIS